VEIIFTERFEQAYEKLTAAGRQSVRKALTLLADNPGYPGLRVKKLQGTRRIWEARPSRRLRMTFEIAGQTIIMRNVGDHDRVLRQP